MKKTLLALLLCSCTKLNPTAETVLYVVPKATCENAGADAARCTLPNDDKVLCELRPAVSAAWGLDKPPFRCTSLLSKDPPAGTPQPAAAAAAAHPAAQALTPPDAAH